MGSRKLRIDLTALIAVLSAAVMAGSAQASFHYMKIREVSGTDGTQNAYVELQMYMGGQTVVGGHDIDIYDADASGGPSATCTISGNVSQGANQRTILVGDTGVANRDVGCDSDADFDMLASGNLADAGAVCFEAIPVDCVSWGGISFTGAMNLPDMATPFGGVLPTANALKRDISAGCATQLEASDDTNSTVADFDEVARDPTPNSTVPVETACSSPPPPPSAKCGGRNATQTGSAGAETLVGTAGKDVIAALGGNDTVRGLAGNDLLCGGGGRDKLIGGGGRDKLFGQAGRDVCKGGPKRDTAKTCETKRTI